MSLAQELTSRNAGVSALAPTPRPAPAPAAKVAADVLGEGLAEAIKTASACAELAKQIWSEIEKVASKGVDPKVSELELTLRKSAHYLGDLVDLVGAQKRAHASLLDQYEQAARVGEALKLASEMVRDGLVPMPDDFNAFVERIAGQDLRVIKAAAEMAAMNDFGRLGEPEEFNEKSASDTAAPSGDGVTPEWERAHSFLLNRR